jgi:hypothetical protein
MNEPSPEDLPPGELSAAIDGHEGEEDLVDEGVELPSWIATAFGVVLVLIALLAIWMAI